MLPILNKVLLRPLGKAWGLRATVWGIMRWSQDNERKNQIENLGGIIGILPGHSREKLRLKSPLFTITTILLYL